MKRVRKPLPVSLRRAIIARNRNKCEDLQFIACSKAVKIGLKSTGYLGNAYYDGNQFYFSRQLSFAISKSGYDKASKLQKEISYFLEGCTFFMNSF